MRSPTPATTSAIAPPPFETARRRRPRQPASSATLHDLPDASISPEADMLLARLIGTAPTRRPRLRDWRQRLRAGDGRRATPRDWTGDPPVRFLFLFWVFVWPVVLTVGIVAAATRAARVALTAAYFIGLLALGAVGDAVQPRFDLGTGLPAVDPVRSAANDSPADVSVAQGPRRRPARSDVHVPRAERAAMSLCRSPAATTATCGDYRPDRLGRPRRHWYIRCAACCRVPDICGRRMDGARSGSGAGIRRSRSATSR